MKTAITAIITSVLFLCASASAQNITASPAARNVTAEDFVTKVYALFSAENSKNGLCEDCKNMLSMVPSEDNMALWLDSADGYVLSYYGQAIPSVSAMATIDNDSVANFGYFFLFPYDDLAHEEMNRRQALFCGCLLQEMQDLGASMGVNTLSDALFEASGDYNGNFVDFRLTEENTNGNTGRYVLYLSVEPHAFTTADALAAL